MIVSIILIVIFFLLLDFTAKLKIHSLNRLYLDNIKSVPNDFRLPKISIIVAGRNEERRIGPALKSMATASYPNFSIIVVNDRSDDQTGSIAEAVAAAHDNIDVIHIEKLPAGWLGKNHALHTGLLTADGEWILFTDADIEFSNDVLKKAVFYCQSNRIDHMTVYPEILHGSALEVGFVCVFGLLFSIDRPSWKVENPNSKKHLGIGAFNLVKKSSLDTIEQFSHLKLSIDDDIRLGELLKAHGFKTKVAFGVNHLALRWQENLISYVKGFEKNAFAGLDFSLAKVSYTLIGIYCTTILPLQTAIASSPGNRVIATGIILLQAVILHDARRNSRISIGYVFLLPISGLFLIYSVAYSTYKTLRAGGVSWRNTFYSLDELKTHVRERADHIKKLRSRHPPFIKAT